MIPAHVEATTIGLLFSMVLNLLDLFTNWRILSVRVPSGKVYKWS